MSSGTTVSVTESLLAALQSEELKEIYLFFDTSYQLHNLQRTVFRIRGVLLDAEAKQELSNEVNIYLGEVEDAIYEADDLLDEFLTFTRRKALLEGDKKAHLSSFKIFLEINKIRQKLDDIASKHQFIFKLDSVPIKMRRPVINPEAHEVNIIGRKDDLEHIVGRMLHAKVQNSVSFISIVGRRGVGKTALAKLVYNDERVLSAFPLRLWICVSEIYESDITRTLAKILASAAGEKHQDSSQLLEQFLGEKYLLVLDDGWNESRDRWLTLVDILRRGQGGSCVVVTTHTLEIASIIGDCSPYRLAALSNENSWRLFKRRAFGMEISNDQYDLIKIGQDIVRKCGGIPLAINVLGSLLYGQDKSKWLSLLEITPSDNGEDYNGITSILELSYHHLESPLKNCFTYFAFFPHDLSIAKQRIMILWMAQGYIVSLNEDQRLEDAAEEYFSILLQRCFLQDAKRDEFGEIISFKIHSLMHDLAKSVARKDICTIDSDVGYVDRKVRHLSLIGRKYAKDFLFKSQIRSLRVGGWYEESEMDHFPLEASITDFVGLRTLFLSNLGIKYLPGSMSKLLHLRYLDLSWNRDLMVLPKTITELYNLMSLKVRGCHRLIELPEDLYKLVELRVLDTEGCYALTYMPHCIGKLNNLHSLTEFVLAEVISSLKQVSDPLEELRALNNLKGHLIIQIRYPKNAAHAKEDRRRGGYLSNKEFLNHITYRFNDMQEGRTDYEEKLIEDLQPHSNLQRLDLWGYDGVKMPRWTTSLPNLVRLVLGNCRKLQYLPYLGNLHNLKVLEVVNLLNLEYIFECSTLSTASSNPEISAPVGVSDGEGLSFLPMLEKLCLNNLPKLKGWSKSGVALVVEDDNVLASSSSMAQLQPLFLSQLKSLTISRCPKLNYNPPSSRVEDLTVVGAKMSLTKKLIDPATNKTHDIVVKKEIEVGASLVPSFHSLNLDLPVEKSPAMIVENATYSDTARLNFNLQPVSSFDGLIAGDALLYCALFPPDYELGKETLLQLWMADGIFHEEPMEEYASRFFDDCVTKGYFLSSRTILTTGEAMYKFKRDNQLLISRGNHFVMIENSSDLIRVSPEVSHVSIRCHSFKDSTVVCGLRRFKQLRTLILIHGHKLSFRQVPRDFFLSLGLLRVLDLSHTCLVELPSSIGNMKYLRYLDLSRTLIKYLPQTIDCLENLQTLKLRGCSNLSSLPKGMRKLAMLRHLDFDVLHQLHSMPEGMGDLSNLRTLSAFLIGVEEGCSIRQLKNLNNLSGSFCISGLENVLTEDEAVNAYLCYKSHIRKLELQWSDSQDKDIVGHREILSFLQPNASLEELCISCFGGFELPFWICDTTFSKLVSITLFKCENCLILPSVGQLPHLNSLNIVGFHKLKMIDHNFYGGFRIQGYIAFPELEKFTIQNMFNLEEWKDIGNSHFPKLSNLTVKHCPKLYSLCTLSFLRSLENLEINQCGMLASCFDGELPANLKTIIIEDCPLISARILEDKGEDYHKVAQIPHVWIDHQEISLCQSSSEEDVDDIIP